MNTKVPEKSFSFLKKPLIPYYSVLSSVIPQKGSEIGQDVRNEDIPIPGFDEFRKFKRINETRIITPYQPESPKEKPTKSDTEAPPLLEIGDVDRFLLKKIKSIPVESLDSLLRMIASYPDIGFVPMNRHHMNLINDYQPYSYTICSYNDVDKTNYATISMNGILEFYKGDADFMALDRLVVEYKLYRALQEIPLFSSLLFWKSFMIWFKKIRRRKFMEAKVKIEAFFDEKYKAYQAKKQLGLH